MSTENRSFQIDSKIVTAFDLWFPKNKQRVLWQKHTVPLDERALAGLAHSAMALDIYTWLAQRLHRVPRCPLDFAQGPIRDQDEPDVPLQA